MIIQGVIFTAPGFWILEYQLVYKAFGLLLNLLFCCMTITSVYIMTVRLIEEQNGSDILKAQKKSLEDAVKEVERKHQVCLYIIQ